MSRIASTFSRLQQHGKTALIPFITAGDPDPQLSVPLMHALVDGGADIIELGVPFSDPMADGPTIQRASERALKHGVSLSGVLAMVAEFRKTDAHTPVVLMGYANPVEALGYERFAAQAATVGVDGVLVVDYPPEEGAALAEKLIQQNIDPIFLLAPTTSEMRMQQVAKLARGFIYYVSLKGVTGAANIDLPQVQARIARIRSHIKLPLGVGFGIRDAQAAQAVARFADAVVVGSRIVQEIENSKPQQAVAHATRLIKEFRSAIDQAKERV